MAERRAVAFGALVVACAAAGGAYLCRSALDARATDGTAGAPGSAPIAPGSLVTLQGAGAVMVAPLDAPGAARPLGLRCDRAYVAGGRGLCLRDTRARVYPPAVAIVFDAGGRELRRFELAGIPSRARVSPGGRYAAATVFVGGESYDSFAGMSTRTSIVDLERGTMTPSLEEFAVTRDGRPFRAADLNVWGVTFDGDSGRFYATVATGRDTFLAAGDVGARTLRVLRAGVECPSLSPDRRRIAYKRRLPDDRWRIHVLELDGMRDRALAGETRSIDDQMEWLDDRTILYAHHEQSFGGPGAEAEAINVWQLEVDGAAPARLLARGAWSPAVVREAYTGASPPTPGSR